MILVLYLLLYCIFFFIFLIFLLGFLESVLNSLFDIVEGVTEAVLVKCRLWVDSIDLYLTCEMTNVWNFWKFKSSILTLSINCEILLWKPLSFLKTYFCTKFCNVVTNSLILHLLEHCFSSNGLPGFSHFVKNQNFRHKFRKNDNRSTLSATKASRNNTINSF